MSPDETPEEPVFTPLNPADPETPLPDQRRKNIKKIILIVVAVFVFFTVIPIAIEAVNIITNKARLKVDFSSAVNRCGKDPVVVVKHHTDFVKTYTDLEIYTPTNPDYVNKKDVYSMDFLGYDRVAGYYCTTEEAMNENNITDDNVNANYTAQEKQLMAKNILESYIDSNGVGLYQIGSILPKLKLSELIVTKKDTRYGETVHYEPYEYRYTLKSDDSPKYLAKEVIFKCGLSDTAPNVRPSSKSAGAKENEVRRDIKIKKPGQNTISASFYSLYGEAVGYGQAWDLYQDGYYSLAKAQCGLEDRHNLITKVEGDAMIDSLKELDLNNLANVELYY